MKSGARKNLHQGNEPLQKSVNPMQNSAQGTTRDQLAKAAGVSHDTIQEIAAEVHEQKLNEAQEIVEAVLDAEAKLGELTSQMEKAQGFASIHPNTGENVKTKTQQLKELGINHHERFETLAKHPETVEQAKADARAEGRIASRKRGRT